ncbi:HprK-related kinase B [Pseudomonadota bacterium]
MTKTINDLNSATTAVIGDAELCNDTLTLGMGEFSLCLRSNSVELLDRLRRYFSHVVAAVDTPTKQVTAIEREAPELGIDFTDWRREPGKTGRKDAYFDIPAARLIQKVRTGMVFLQSNSQRIAAGPCLDNDNQVINFINAQYMNWLQQRNWLICHASGLVLEGRTLAIAGFSSGGKSTLMLRLLDNDQVSYLTNDRLFIRRQDDGVDTVGIPKLPRINPGTIVHNPKLHALIPAQQRQKLLALPAEELWHLEEKYDVHVEQVYGANRITQTAPLGAFLVLNWRRDSDQKLELKKVKLGTRQELLSAIMKSPGPFYQYADGGFFQDTTELNSQEYLSVLENIPVYEATGRTDFDALTSICKHDLMN